MGGAIVTFVGIGGGAAFTETVYTDIPPTKTAPAEFDVVTLLGGGGVAGVTVLGAGAEASMVADEAVEVFATTLGGRTTTVDLGAGALALTVTTGIGGGGGSGRLAVNETCGARIAPCAWRAQPPVRGSRRASIAGWSATDIRFFFMGNSLPIADSDAALVPRFVEEAISLK